MGFGEAGMDVQGEWDSVSSCFDLFRTIDRFGCVVDVSDFRTAGRYLVLRGIGSPSSE